MEMLGIHEHMGKDDVRDIAVAITKVVEGMAQ